MAQSGNKEVDELVDTVTLGPVRRKISEYMDKVPDPGKLFQKKEEKPSTPFKYDGPKEKEAQRKASEAAKKKVNAGDTKPSAAIKKPPVKKTIQRKRVAGKK